MNKLSSFSPIDITSNISDPLGAAGETKDKLVDGLSTMAIVTSRVQDNLIGNHSILLSSSFDVTKPLSDVASTNVKDVLSGTNTMQT